MQKKKYQSNKVLFNVPGCLKSILIKFQSEAGACSNKRDQYEAFIQISSVKKQKQILTLHKNTRLMRKPLQKKKKAALKRHNQVFMLMIDSNIF